MQQTCSDLSHLKFDVGPSHSVTFIHTPSFDSQLIVPFEKMFTFPENRKEKVITTIRTKTNVIIVFVAIAFLFILI